MKVKTITRSTEACTRERSNDMFVLRKNPDPLLHPFEQAREYTRALNAVKLERTFAKPFVASLAGHVDGVYCMNRHPTNLKSVISGSADGEVRLWNLATQTCIWSARSAHTAFVRGVAFIPATNNSQAISDKFISCGDDAFVRLWDSSTPQKPTAVFQGDASFTGLDTHRYGQLFATSGKRIDIWNTGRAEPIQSFEWGSDTISTVKFNQAEVNVLASCGNDRSVVLHDLRTASSLAKVILQMRSNSLAWNPMEAYYFSVANEDYHSYTFDMRYLNKALNVLTGHVSAVLDIDYSPTGREIVTGGYDRTIRIFNTREGQSRDVYHTRRMQRLFCVKYSMDSNYIMSGSDDGNIRLWKTCASEKLGVKNLRERAAADYADALKDRYKALPEIKRISKHRHIPKQISSAAKTLHIQRESIKRKDANVRKHSKPGAIPDKNLRKDAIVTTTQ